MILFKNLSIKVKMLLVIQLVSLFSLLIGFGYVIYSNIANFKEDLKNNTIINANLIGDYCAVPLAFDVSDNAKETLEKLKNIPSVKVGVVYNNNDEIFAEFYSNNEKINIPSHLKNESWSEFNDDYLYVYQVINYENEYAGTICLVVSTEELSNKIQNYLFTMSILLIFILIVNYFLSLALQRVISGPILKLTNATIEISTGGNYQLRVKKQGNDEIGILVDEYNKMLEKVFEREESLKNRTEELTHTLEDLKKAQEQLVNSEKMAALGQLIANVAHEINTPLGAIRSSIGNIKSSLNIVLQEYMVFASQLPTDVRLMFSTLIEESINNKCMLTSKEERVYKKKITSILESYDIEDAYSFADTFVDMTIVENIERYLPLLQQKDSVAIIEMAYKVSSIQRSTENIETAAARASKVVFALKNFSRIGSGDEQILTDVTEGLETVLTLYYNQIKQGIEVSKNYEKIPKIPCYSDELNQVWTNILHNAIYAMELNGKMNISVYADNTYVIVAITDSGKGISPEVIDHIFDPFFSTKPVGEGTGIGLDITKRIVEKHRGKIEVESKPGKTVFRVYLPIGLGGDNTLTT